MMQAAAQPLHLNLVCVGAGTQGKLNTTTVALGNLDGTVSSWHDRDFEDAVKIEIAGDTGRVRIPQTMLPPVRGGKNGWMTLKKVEVGADEITAQAAINIFNTAKLRIDRITGTLSMSVLKGQFTGRCQAYDPDKTDRAF